MLIAKYLVTSNLYKFHNNGKAYYKMDFLSCGSGFYADTDEEAIELFAQWCRVPKEYITRVA
jgi:hypothetical protein